MRIVEWIGRTGDKFGGLESRVLLLAEKCSERGHELVVMNDFPNTSDEYLNGLKTFGATFIVIGDSYYDYLKMSVNLVRFICRWKPDVVVTNFVNPLAVPLLKILGVPLIYRTYHTGVNNEISLRTKFLIRIIQICTTRIFTVSEQLRLDLIGAGADPLKTITVYQGINLKKYEVGKAKINEPVPARYYDKNARIIISVARFSPEKGMRLIVDAAIEVVKKNSDVIWWLVGLEGDDTPYVLEAIREACLEDRILILGERNDVPALMNRAYLHVIGSIYEGLPFSVVEASASSVPTVGTNVCGVREAVVDGRTGILVHERTGSALARAALQILDDSSLRNKLGLAARDYANQNFNAEMSIQYLLDIYDNDCMRKLRKGFL